MKPEAQISSVTGSRCSCCNGTGRTQNYSSDGWTFSRCVLCDGTGTNASRDMNSESQIKALANLDGYRCFDVTPPLRYLTAKGSPAFAYILGSSGWFWTSNTPNYLHSYDAIIPLIQKQPPEIKWKFIGHLALMLKPGQYNWDATTEQLCEALLRAHELWEE